MATGKDIIKSVTAVQVSFSKLWFVAIPGQLRSFSLSPREPDNYLPLL